jgi:hypothetical protein
MASHKTSNNNNDNAREIGRQLANIAEQPPTMYSKFKSSLWQMASMIKNAATSAWAAAPALRSKTPIPAPRVTPSAVPTPRATPTPRVVSNPTPRIIITNECLNGAIREGTIKNHGLTDEVTFLERNKLQVLSFLNSNINNKVRLLLYCKMRKVDASTGEFTYETKSFHSGAATEVIAATDLSELYNTMVDHIKESFATFLDGWEWMAIT